MEEWGVACMYRVDTTLFRDTNILMHCGYLLYLYIVTSTYDISLLRIFGRKEAMQIVIQLAV